MRISFLLIYCYYKHKTGARQEETIDIIIFFGGKDMKNVDIRNYAKEHKVNLWEVSERLGYAHETAFSRVLRHELPEDKKVQIKVIIDDLAAE